MAAARRAYVIGAAALLAAGCGRGGASAPHDAAMDKTDAVDAADGAGETENPWANCTWEGTTSMVTANTPIHGNNIADLAGAFLGDTVFDPAVQRKKVALMVDAPAPDLELGDAYVVRLTPTTEAGYLIVALKNIGQTDLCFIKATNYRWLGADGTALTGASGMEFHYVDGTVRVVNGLFTDSCLGAGESGYFTDVIDPEGGILYSRVAAIGFNLSGPFPTADMIPDGRLVATAYDVGTCAAAHAKRSLKVTLANTGTGSVALEKYSFSPAVLLDEAGLPLGWFFLQVPDHVDVAAGQTTTAFASLFMEPKLRRMQIFVDFTSTM